MVLLDPEVLKVRMVLLVLRILIDRRVQADLVDLVVLKDPRAQPDLEYLKSDLWVLGFLEVLAVLMARLVLMVPMAH